MYNITVHVHMAWSQKFRKSEISLDTGPEFKNFGTEAESESEEVTPVTSDTGLPIFVKTKECSGVWEVCRGLAPMTHCLSCIFYHKSVMTWVYEHAGLVHRIKGFTVATNHQCYW